VLDLTKIRKLQPAIQKAVDVVVFKPTLDQKRAKSNYWSYFMSSEAPEAPEIVSEEIALRYAGDKRLSDWWSLEGFQDWFLNKDEFRQRVEFLADISLDELQLLIRDENTNATAKISAIKMVLEAAGKLAKPAEATGKGTSPIESMTKQELERFIQKKMLKVMPEMSEVGAGNLTENPNNEDSIDK
jgi:hypothetical protein